MTDDFKITDWPSTPEEKRWHRFLQAATNKWGYEQVRAADVYALFDERVALNLPEFETLAPGRHQHSVDGEIVQIIRLNPLKGAMYRIGYGMLLTFMPVESGAKLKRGRLSAQSNYSLWDEPREVEARKSAPAITMLNPLNDTDLIRGVHNLHGRGFVQHTLEHHWRHTLPAMTAWFRVNTTIDALLETALKQSTDPNFSTHHPRPSLVAAFLLARLGQLAEAERQLETWAAKGGLWKAPLTAWQDHLRQAASP
ncbi:MAG: hypothetical protein ABL889_03435 [Terricaulis sp.]